MTDRLHDRSGLLRKYCWVVVVTLAVNISVRAEGCVGFGCAVNGGPLEFSMLTGIGFLYTTVRPIITTSEASDDGPSKHYTQALIDDAAAHLATDGVHEGPILESEWRDYLKQYGPQASKKEFARMVLATYG